MHRFFLLFLTLFAACKSAYNPTTPFDARQTPPGPDYSRPESWSALPQRADSPDATPSAALTDRQAAAQVDIFFIHPTTLTEDKKEWKVWNARIDDTELNQKTDDVPVKFQASAFNGAGKIYAPRYRQAHYHSFFTTDKASADEALDTAYSDVLNAFRYYIHFWNNGRPFIIAGHSQGALHAMRLLKEQIEQTPLRNQLVAAYIPGWPVPDGYFQEISPCETPDATGCFCSWRTYERNYGLKHAHQPEIVCTNPLLWTTEKGKYADRSLNTGTVLYKFDKIYPQLCDAEVYKGVLLCTKPKFRGSILIRTKNYHPGDINLYYNNIRENAILRSTSFLEHWAPSGQHK